MACWREQTYYQCGCTLCMSTCTLDPPASCAHALVSATLQHVAGCQCSTLGGGNCSVAMPRPPSRSPTSKVGDLGNDCRSKGHEGHLGATHTNSASSRGTTAAATDTARAPAPASWKGGGGLVITSVTDLASEGGSNTRSMMWITVLPPEMSL